MKKNNLDLLLIKPGSQKELYGKLSDDSLTDCPVCGAPKFNKQLTAPGFQLKGTGWYATDFKGGGAAAAALHLVALSRKWARQTKGIGFRQPDEIRIAGDNEGPTRA